MKCIVKSSLIGALGLGVLLLFSTHGAYAAETASGTTIGNKATVDYTVGGVNQTDIESSPTGNSTPGTGNGTSTDFLVDTKLLLSVVTQDTALVTTVPGAASAVTTFKVQNLGNAAQAALLTTVREATGTTNPFGAGTSTFQVSTAAVYKDVNTNGTYDPGTDTLITSIPTLAAAGGSATVFVVSSIPVSVSNGDLAVVALVAQVADNNTTTASTDDSADAWTTGTVQEIFADTTAGTDDSALDGKASDRSGYTVNSADLTITKTASVVSDPTGAATPHAIPGAVIKYTITVANNGSASATSVAITDQIGTTNIVFKPNSMTLTIAGTAEATCSDAADTDKCTYTSGTTTVTATGITLAATKSAVLTFEVTIQ